jgi:hypothetical protein
MGLWLSHKRGTNSQWFFNVMAALVAAIHVLRAANKDVDGRDKPGHDDNKSARPSNLLRSLRKFVPQMCNNRSPNGGGERNSGHAASLLSAPWGGEDG